MTGLMAEPWARSDPDAPTAGLSLVRQRDYQDLVINGDYPELIERQIAVVIGYYKARNAALVTYLRGTGGKRGVRGNEARSRAWSRADSDLFAAITTLAAGIGSIHPSPLERLPDVETSALIEHRVGPLCSGWSPDESGYITHAPSDNCARHPKGDIV